MKGSVGFYCLALFVDSNPVRSTRLVKRGSGEQDLLPFFFIVSRGQVYQKGFCERSDFDLKSSKNQFV